MTNAEVKGPVLGMRHVQTLLMFLCLFTLYFTRHNVALSVVALTDASGANPNYPEYDWTAKQKSYILSSFFWGNIWTQFLGGYLCKHYGVKLIMFVGTFGSTLLMALTPPCIWLGGWQAYLANRVLIGAFQGVIIPCVHQHLSNWAPLQERTRLGAFAYTGFDCGTVFAMLFTGLIATSSWGWPGISYVVSTIGFVWCVLWLGLGANKPSEAPCISAAECEFISKTQRVEQSIPIPWRAIFGSSPFRALLVTRCAAIWGLTTLQTELPSYLRGVMQLDIKSNALFSALPFIGMWAASYVFLVASDLLVGRKCLTLTQLRKSFNSISFLVPAACLVAIGFLDVQQKTLAIVLMTLSNTIYSGSTIGSSLNTIDLAPNHAGILMGIVNTCSNLTGLFAPLLVGAIVKNEADRTEWQIVFIVSAVIYVIGTGVYLKWGTAESQPWNAPDYLTQNSTTAIDETYIVKFEHTASSMSISQGHKYNQCTGFASS